MSSKLLFFNWEYRPAIISGTRAWAVLAPGEDWEEVNEAEVDNSGALLSRKDFEEMFVDDSLPPLPRDATDPAQSLPADTTVAE